MTQRDRAKSTLKEMESQLKKLENDVSFREFIGFELCLNMFKKRYFNLLDISPEEAKEPFNFDK